MKFWDFVKMAILVNGVDHMVHRNKKKKRDGYDPGAWRREIDKENDSYRHYDHEDDY